jgi:RHS repeat-associated protein
LCTATDPGPANILDLQYNFSLGTADNGNVNGITNNRDTTRSQNFYYDALNRLLTAETTSTQSNSIANCWGESYIYDNAPSGSGAWGNLMEINVASSSYNRCTQENLSTTVSAQNRLNSVGYDTAGNSISYGSSTYTYNAENQLTQAAAPSAVGYVYDGDGKRVEKTSGGTPYKLYWYDPNGNVLDETDQTGVITNSSFSEYVFFGSQRIGRRDSASDVFYYSADHLGTSREILQAGQTSPCYESDFYPFGGERTPIVDTCVWNNYKFTGKERDTESNLDNLEARYDASNVARFESPDPSFESALRGNPQTWNRYSYVLNNPLRFIDPTGELWQQNMNGGWDWQTVCSIGQTCVTQIAEQEGNKVVTYGPSGPNDKQSFAENQKGYVNVGDIAKTDGAYFQFQSGVTATYASPQTAVDLYNGAFDCHLDYPNDAKLSLNDIGVADGSVFSPHATHNLGRSFDMSYIGQDGQPIHKGNLGVWLADDKRMLDLVRIFKQNGFNQNYSDNDNGLGVSYAPGHMNHIHFGKTAHTAQCEIGPC